jgi:hypothetical protein
VKRSTYQRIVEKIDIDRESGCWNWTGVLVRGYGQIRLDGRSQYTHRVSYQLAYGPIPDGLVIDHLCVNPRCCNPAHLEAVTQQVNMSRGKWATKTHCPKGHEYTIENTYVQVAHGLKRRFCRACGRTSSAAYASKNRAA